MAKVCSGSPEHGPPVLNAFSSPPLTGEFMFCPPVQSQYGDNIYSSYRVVLRPVYEVLYKCRKHYTNNYNYQNSAWEKGRLSDLHVSVTFA